LMVVLLFSGLLISSINIVEEKSSKAFFRNFITPTSNSTFVIGNYISNLLIILLQVVIIFLALYIFSEAKISLDIALNLALIILIVSSVFIVLGMLIGYLFKSGEAVNLASISLACILLFFSSVILPLETLPSTIRTIVNYNPFIIGVNSLKVVLLFKAPLNLIAPKIYLLLIYFAVFLILVFITRVVSKTRYGE